jgi:hypothetical protein
MIKAGTAPFVTLRMQAEEASARGGGGMSGISYEVAAHYEESEVAGGKLYRWAPGRAVIECDCGRTFVADAGATSCACGADHARVVAALAENGGETKSVIRDAVSTRHGGRA